MRTLTGEWTVVSRKPAQAEWQLRSSDWDAPLIAYSNVATSLEALEDKKVLQAEALQILLKTSSKAFSLLAVVPGSYAQAVRTPGSLNGKLALRMARCVQCCSAGVKAPQPTGMKQDATSVAVKDTCVVNVKIYKRYLEKSEWDVALKSPVRYFHTWLSKWRVKAHDSWGWCKEELPNEGEGKLYGLARVLTSDLTTLLAHSGNAVFVDPTRTCGAPPCQLTWIEKAAGESNFEYSQRVCKMPPTLGVTVGRNKLVTRSPRD